MHRTFLYSLAAVGASAFLSAALAISPAQTFPASPGRHHRSTGDDHARAQAGLGALPGSEFSGVARLALSGDLAVVDTKPVPEFNQSGTLLNGSSDSVSGKVMAESSETADSLNAAQLGSYLMPATPGDTAMRNLSGMIAGF